jgi:hypothetical protein
MYGSTSFPFTNRLHSCYPFFDAADIVEARFKWSDVNGSLATRVVGFTTEGGTLSRGATRIVVENLGLDKDTMFKIGDYIEITDDANDLADYTQNPTLEAGEIRQITDVDIDENTLSWDSTQLGEFYAPLDTQKLESGKEL